MHLEIRVARRQEIRDDLVVNLQIRATQTKLAARPLQDYLKPEEPAYLLDGLEHVL